jgi:hypothetical protein
MRYIASMNATTTTTPATTAHPFELAGMGYGPYRFNGIHDIAEAREHAMNHLGGTHAAEHPKLEAGLGTCCNCGMAINIVCIVQSADGRLWGVGSDCVEKVGDAHLGDKVKVAIARRRRAKAAAKREEARKVRHQEWLAAACTAKDALPGETNEQYKTRQYAAEQEREAAYKAKVAERQARFAQDLATLQAIAETGNTFAASMMFALQEGPLTPRQADCTAKFFHRRGTASHAELVERFMA